MVESAMWDVFSKLIQRPEIQSRADPLVEFLAERSGTLLLGEPLRIIEQKRTEGPGRLLRKISA